MKENKTNGFNLVSVIVIIVITSIISGIASGIIVFNSYKKLDITGDKNLRQFLEVYQDITKNYYQKVDKEKMLNKAIDAMLEYLGDSYTTYMNKEEAKQLEEKLDGTYRGIGVSFLEKKIIEVLKDTPAEEAGLLPGDVFLKIDDTVVNNLSDYKIGELIKNNNKNKVNILVLRNGQEILVSNIEIRRLANYFIASKIIAETSIGYISLPIFSRSSSKQSKDALDKLEKEGMNRLIIDLRNNTGGYLEEASSLASYFLKKGQVIYSLVDKDKKNYYYDENEIQKNYPIVLLLNNNSASASEILAAALKDSYGAIIIGERSFGKGKVQQTYNLNNGGKAKYTSAKWYRPNEFCVDGVGITPDYEIKLEYTYDENGNINGVVDTQLNKAIEVIKNL